MCCLYVSGVRVGHREVGRMCTVGNINNKGLNNVILEMDLNNKGLNNVILETGP